MSYKNRFKQQAFEKFLEKKGGFLDEKSPISRYEFEENYWKKGLRIARAEGLIGKASRKGQFEISKNADIIVEEYLTREFSKIRFYEKMQDSNMKFTEKYQRFGYDSESGRLTNFLEKYGKEIYEGAPINTWYSMFMTGFIDKDEFNEKIKKFKKMNEKYLKMNYQNSSDRPEIKDYASK